ncbi:MAG TPA: penicillin-binding protein 2 [Aggregatilineales bacterium]|nr:penicillin-binding protein 2 [Aggregatilineales bacterium]
MTANATARPLNPQRDVFNQRLPLVIVVMVIVSGALLLRMLSFQQLAPEVLNELRPDYDREVRLAAARGLVYDHNGQRLAVNTLEYRIGVSPNLVSDPPRTARLLATILGIDELEVFRAVTSTAVWELLASRVPAEIGQQVEQLKNDGQLLAVTIEKIPRRSYPQGTLGAQLLGFVGGDLKGYYGVEGRFQDQIAGRAREEIVSDIPFAVPNDTEPDRGADIYLTIDRDIQFLVESQLALAVDQTGASGGTIIVMNPRNGNILGMASWPSFDPNAFLTADVEAWRNPAISDEYEPGSVLKVLTVAAGIEAGTITPNWTYNDQGRLDICGVPVLNWDRRAYGVVDTTGLLVNSLNVGAGTIALEMGPNSFYAMMSRFGMGRLTGINLAAEADGTMLTMGDPEWSQSNLCTNAFGQGIAVTPLQLVTAVSAIANDGLMMQPNVVERIVDGDQIIWSQPTALGRPISADTAHTVRDMMVQVVNQGLDEGARLSGYTVAGKTGTAEIPIPTGYRTDRFIMSFIGFLPADDPQVIVLVKLDEPTSGNWASQVAAPVFRQLAERLVILLEIPPDAVRQALIEQGGAVNAIQR